MGSLGFLLNDKGRTARVERLLDAYSKALHRISDGGMEALARLKRLGTGNATRHGAHERLSNSKDRNGMLRKYHLL